MTGASFGFGDSILVRFGNVFADVRSELLHRAHARRVAREMFALDEHGLEDLGYCRADISDIAAGKR